MAVAIHLSKLILSWLNVIRVGLINKNPISARALTLLKLIQILGDSLEVVVSSVAEHQANDHSDGCEHSVLHLLSLRDADVLPEHDLWVDDILDFHVSYLDQSLLLEELVEAAALGGDYSLDPVEVVALDSSYLTLH